jgi:hypothetical protein
MGIVGAARGVRLKEECASFVFLWSSGERSPGCSLEHPSESMGVQMDENERNGIVGRAWLLCCSEHCAADAESFRPRSFGTSGLMFKAVFQIVGSVGTLTWEINYIIRSPWINRRQCICLVKFVLF